MDALEPEPQPENPEVESPPEEPNLDQLIQKSHSSKICLVCNDASGRPPNFKCPQCTIKYCSLKCF